MRVSAKRLLFIVGAVSCVTVLLTYLALPPSRKRNTELHLLELLNTDGSLTDEFKEELDLKKRLLEESTHSKLRNDGAKIETAEGGPTIYRENEKKHQSHTKHTNHLSTKKTLDAQIGPITRTAYSQQDRGAVKVKATAQTENIPTYFVGENVPDDIIAMKPPTYLTNYKNPCWYENRTLRCLPYFHLAGVDKSGTTDLWYRLAKHPQIVKPNAVMGKETHWWSWRRFGFDIWVRNRPIRHFDWYLGHFDLPAKTIQQTIEEKGDYQFHPMITGEGSPTVFWDFTGWDQIPQNKGLNPEDAILTPHCIAHLTPFAKIIVILRNPTDRLYSDYKFLDRFRSQHNISVINFHEDVKTSIDMLQHCFRQRSETSCLLDKELHMRIPVRLIVGMYDFFLAHWLKAFPPDQILVMRNEDYSANIGLHLEAVFSFLQLKALPKAQIDKISALPRVFETQTAKKLGPMLKETRELLDNFYAKYNQKLSDRFQNKKYLWLST